MRAARHRTLPLAHGERQTLTQEDRVSLTYVRHLWHARQTDQVLAHLTAALRDVGMAVNRCEVLAANASPPSDAWCVSLENVPYQVCIHGPNVTAPDLQAQARPWVALACLALARLLQERAQHERLALALDEVGASLDEDAVLDALVQALHRHWHVPHVRLFRYLPGGLFRLEREALSGTPLFPLQPRVELPATWMPAAHRAVETGETLVVGREGHITDWERQVLFPVPVAVGVLLPFWLDPQHMGLLALGWTKPLPLGEDMHLLEAHLRFLVHHTALALARARLHREALAAQEEAALMMEHALAGMILVSSGLRVLRANAAAARLWQATPDDLVGRHVADLLGEAFLHTEGPWQRACREGEVGPVEWQVTVPPGQVRDLLLTVVRLKPPLQEKHAGLISLLDVSERKQVERWQQRVLAGVSHEMRTPLAAIKGFAELLYNAGPEVDAALFREALTTILHRATELEELITLYLDFIHLESGQFRAEYQEIDLPTLVRRLLDNIRHLHEPAPRVLVEMDAGLGRVRTDVRLFTHIFYQILDNALRYTPADGEVRVRVWREGAAVHLEVSDTGPGIPRDRLAHLFTPFYLSQEGGEYTVGGSGLGLAVVRAAVETLGGAVHVDSAAGQGTTVRVVLPG